MLSALISIFYFSKVLNDKVAELLRMEYNQSYDESQEYIRCTTDIVRELRYVAVKSCQHGARARLRRLPPMPCVHRRCFRSIP
ncbi:MAG: hypothetical protein ACR5LD_08225 [Symbiopectobacterium sp.]